MKSFRNFLAFFLSLFLFFQPLPSVFAQSLNPNGNLFNITQPKNGDTGRIRGKSFGTSEESQDSALPFSMMGGVAGQVFQEPTFSGLTYQIHILGEVERPGTYRVVASTRLSEALEKAGGVLKQGSERRVEIRRKGSANRSVDLLSFKLSGNLDANPYLLDNDIVFVPLLGKVIQVAGTVKRPGIYELRNEKNLQDLLPLLGGFTPGVAETTPIKVIRFKSGQRQILDVENDEESRKKFKLESGDVIVFHHFLTKDKKFDYNLAQLPGDNELFYPSYEERVFVLGAVARPGPIAFNPYFNVRQYLTLAGGLTKLAKSNKKIRILTVDGKNLKADESMSVSPGDTIVVPEKYMAPEGVLSLVLGMTTSILGITTTVLTLTR